jgi:hypothetical protein
MDARAGASPAVATRSDRLSVSSSHLKSFIHQLTALYSWVFRFDVDLQSSFAA